MWSQKVVETVYRYLTYSPAKGCRFLARERPQGTLALHFCLAFESRMYLYNEAKYQSEAASVSLAI